MNDEIREILDKMRNFMREPIEIKMYGISLLHYQVKQLLDYITNLQQENEKLLNENIVIKDVKYMVEETIYKSRCEKAIEYIENPSHEMSVLTYQNLLNILQNGSDNQ